MAALEAAIEHGGVAWGCFGNLQQLLGQRRVAAFTVGGTQVQVGQLAFKKARQHRTDGVRIPQHGHTVLRTDAVQLGTQLRVVRRPDGIAARSDLCFIGHIACCVDGRVVESIDRAQAGNALPRVQAGAIGRAVHVDHIARMRGHEDGRPHIFRKRIEALHVPVGIGHLAGLIGEARGQRRRHVGACMGHGHQQRCSAGVKDKRRWRGIGHHKLGGMNSISIGRFNRAQWWPSALLQTHGPPHRAACAGRP